jgi:hypothetical protein
VKVAAVERRFVPGKIFVGLVRGFGLKNGAVGCRSAWDTSDIIVAGANDRDMADVVNRIHALRGRLVLCAGGRVLAEIPLPVDAHLVSARPFLCGVPRVRDVESRRERPFPSSIHEECDVLDVIVTVAAHHIEKSPQHLFLHVFPRKAQSLDDSDCCS